MKTKTIGQIRSLFTDLYTQEEIFDDQERQSLYILLTEKYQAFGRDALYIPQGEILRLLQKHAPTLVDADP